MQEMISLIHRLHHVENVIKFEIERYSSQYENKKVEHSFDTLIPN